jgi:hypothetical protein
MFAIILGAVFFGQARIRLLDFGALTLVSFC